MFLTDMKCRTATPKTKPYKLSDGDGLYLEVMPKGGKYWRQKYYVLGKEKRIAHGVYPEVSLSEAREKRSEIKEQLKQGLDPSLVRLEKKQIARAENAETFEKLAEEWLTKQVGCWTPRYARSVKYRLEKYVYTELGSYPVIQIKPHLMLACLQKIEKTSPETTRRIKALCSHVFKYAIATGRTRMILRMALKWHLKNSEEGTMHL